MKKKQAKQLVKNYLIIAGVVYLLLYLTNKKLFYLDLVSPPYP